MGPPPDSGFQTIALNGIFEAFSALLPLFIHTVILQSEMGEER